MSTPGRSPALSSGASLALSGAKPSHIAICVPCVDKPQLQFTHSLATLMYHAGRAGQPIATVFHGGSIITNTRNNCLKHVEDFERDGTEFSHILFLDSDMVFPQDTLYRLLTHAKAIVGCTYRQRTAPYNLHGKTLDARTTDVADAGLIEVAGIPTGCILIHREVFRRFRRPYFRLIDQEESAPGRGDHVSYGEDYVFCATARAAGFKIWLDTALSKEIGHVGEKVLYPDQEVFSVPEDGSLESLQAKMLEIQEKIAEILRKKAA